MRRSKRDKAEQLDRALDALMRGDHSKKDALPPEMAATVDRLMWLSQDGTSQKREAIPGFVAGSALHPVRRLDRPEGMPGVETNQAHPASPAQAPGEPTALERHRARRGVRSLPVVMRIAAVLVLIVVAGGLVWEAYPLLTEMREGDSDHAAGNPELLFIQPLDPERCAVDPTTRQHALEILRDVDVDRDEAVRRSSILYHKDPGAVPTEMLNATFTTWQACRRFGFTYKAMTLQAPYFTREDFYGETTHDFRGPVETAYSDATLNEMLDRREQLDATSYRYWEALDFHPDPTWTLILGGEVFATPNRLDMVAIRAMTYDVEAEEWIDTPTVVVFQLVEGQFKLFDIQTTPVGTPPYM